MVLLANSSHLQEDVTKVQATGKIPAGAAVIRNQEEFMIRKVLVLAAVALAVVTSSVLSEQAQAGPGYHCTKYPNGRVHCN